MAATPTASEPDVVYAPGACNLGGDEVAFRRKVGWVGVGVSAVLTAVLFALGAPFWAFFFVAVPAGVAAIGFVQAQASFCVRYADEGVYNVGEGFGNTQKVTDDIAHAADVARAKQLKIRAALIAVGTGVVLAAIAAAIG